MTIGWGAALWRLFIRVQFNGSIMLAAAWSTQIGGHVAGENFGLDLTNFPQQRGNLNFEGRVLTPTREEE
jgi:hypothetical protein